MDEKKKKNEEIVGENEDTEDLKAEQENPETDDVAHLQNALTEADEKYKRALADYQNLKRYTEDQKSVWARQSAREIVLKLLPVLDTLMLVQKHLSDNGLDLAIKHFLDTLATEGVVQIKTVGQTFDPLTMECITIKIGKDGMVLEEVRAGYMLNESVLRPAQVIVGQGEK